MRVTVSLGRPMPHAALLIASSEFYWHSLDETHTCLIAGTAANKVSRVQAQAKKF